ncbi:MULTISPECIES: hypothetical protein [unclassified Sphingomonas]|jgi:hypothetical protein|uniref:hypothetical protein n=1 Tax=unclassified Sphingomonas TaxID=196159 RepID=UPI00082D53C6|nr:MULTISPECIES: hypothetical protein [unclassified Sphingomonas]
MDPIVYILAVMGCADDGARCQQARIEPVVYRSIAQCQAAMPAVLPRHTDLAYPMLSGACQQRSERQAQIEVARASRG